MSAERAATHRTSPDLALIVALDVERACIATPVAGAGSIALLQSGPGPSAAGRAAAAAIAAGAAGIVSCGLAGALVPHVVPGCVLLPRSIVRTDGTRLDTAGAWRHRLADALRQRFAIDEGALLAAEDVLETPAAKRQAAERSGAVAVDTESGAIAATAARAGVPCIVLRVVTDAASDVLPAGIGRFVDGNGDRRLAPLVAAALQPACWRPLWTLARRYRVAARMLTEVATEVAARGFLLHA